MKFSVFFGVLVSLEFRDPRKPSQLNNDELPGLKKETFTAHGNPRLVSLQAQEWFLLFSGCFAGSLRGCGSSSGTLHTGQHEAANSSGRRNLAVRQRGPIPKSAVPSSDRILLLC